MEEETKNTEITALQEKDVELVASKETTVPTPPPTQQVEVPTGDPAQNEQEGHKQSGKMNEEEIDATDAFAAAMGQAVAPPTPIITKVYSVKATEEALRGLEAFMRDNGITFNVQ